MTAVGCKPYIDYTSSSNFIRFRHHPQKATGKNIEGCNLNYAVLCPSKVKAPNSKSFVLRIYNCAVKILFRLCWYTPALRLQVPKYNISRPWVFFFQFVHNSIQRGCFVRLMNRCGKELGAKLSHMMQGKFRANRNKA